jgi:uncharacterized membrane protein
MADFSGTTTVTASEDVLFDFLSDVGNLPRYFARMQSAESGSGEEVHTTATLPDGTKVEGTAWFRVDHDARHLAWGSEGDSDYHGYLDVRGREAGSEVEVHIHTNRVDEGDDSVQEGIDKTLISIKMLVEDRGEV